MRYLTLLLSLLLASVVFAQSPFADPTLGTRPGAFSARSLGLGRTFLVHETGPAAMMGNPATLANQEKPWRIDLSADVSRVKETRSYPFYDAFDGVLGYNNYAMNDHLYSKLDGGVAWRVPLEPTRSLVLSAASYSTYRFDYRYHEEVRNRYTSGGIQDLKLGDNRLDITGDLRSITVGAAAKAMDQLAVGFSVSALQGDWSYTRGVYYADKTDTTKKNQVDFVEYSPNGTPAEMNVGALFSLSERVSVGARALLPTGDFKFDKDVKLDGFSKNVDSVAISSGTITQTYPSHFAVGVQYRPQNEYRPILILETEIHTYKDVDKDFDNTFEIRAGAEQQIVPGAPVRLGFVYYTSPTNDEQATTLFSAGIGFHLQRLTGDFGFELGKLNYVNPDLFRQSLYDETDRTDSDHVETALFRGMITLRYEL
jgi:hypothetical protein